MKKLLITLGLFFALLANAAVSVTSTVATNTTVVATPQVVQTLTVSTGTNLVLRLYDAANSTNMVWVNAQYTNYVAYMTNHVNNFVDSTGTTNFHTNYVLYTSLQTVAAATSNLTPFYTVAVAANTTPTFTLNTALLRGLTVSNDVPATFIVTYRNP